MEELKRTVASIISSLDENIEAMKEDVRRCGDPDGWMSVSISEMEDLRARAEATLDRALKRVLSGEDRNAEDFYRTIDDLYEEIYG